MQPQRRDSRAVGKVYSCAEKIKRKSLEMVGVVRDNALAGQVKLAKNHLSGNATNQELAAKRTESEPSRLSGVANPSDELMPEGQLREWHKRKNPRGSQGDGDRSCAMN